MGTRGHVRLLLPTSDPILVGAKVFQCPNYTNTVDTTTFYASFVYTCISNYTFRAWLEAPHRVEP